jgi:hypothetical protein
MYFFSLLAVAMIDGDVNSTRLLCVDLSLGVDGVDRALGVDGVDRCLGLDGS